MSAPIFLNSLHLSSASSSPRPARASVRAMTRMSAPSSLKIWEAETGGGRRRHNSSSKRRQQRRRQQHGAPSSKNRSPTQQMALLVAATGTTHAVGHVERGPHVATRVTHLASHAALTRLYASSLPTTVLPLVWPQRLGATWSSIMMPAMPTCVAAMGTAGSRAAWEAITGKIETVLVRPRQQGEGKCVVQEPQQRSVGSNHGK